jgi:hypothetical protein
MIPFSWQFPLREKWMRGLAVPRMDFSGRSSDSDSSAVGAFPVATSGMLPQHRPYSVGHVAELHRLPDSPRA